MRRLLALLAILCSLQPSLALGQSIAVTSVNGIWPDATGNVVIATGASIGAPNARSMSLATAYQATNTAKSAIFTINITSSPVLTLSGGQTDTAQIYVGPTSGVASGTGTDIATVTSALTGTLVIGVTITAGSTSAIPVFVPPGYYVAVLQTSGTVSIASAFDQSIG